MRGKNNPHFESHVCDIQLNKLDKICNVQDSKFVSFLLCVTKRAKSEESAPPQLSLKIAVGSNPEPLDESTLKQRVKVMQYEAMMVTDIKEFKQGQVFQ